ncbi:DUF429 domain-containing protein [Aromatoleum sp.]|uniref:DUF429 domain-containing protein n=1 Tax=Aromatoleum sp. TaxID=2307007 RepID=UPI002FC77B82
MKAATLFGVDFTSAPCVRKPITVAAGRVDRKSIRLDALELLQDWPAFEAFLDRPGPWLGAFDFPFGLPREAIVDLGWPMTWTSLVEHCASLGRQAFREQLDAYRATRPPGKRYAHRAADAPARSHSPLKLVNPPVGLMFVEGVPRLLRAGVSLPGLQDAEPSRIALEAYPGLLARAISRAPYKTDERAKQTGARRDARESIVAALESGAHPLGLPLSLEGVQRAALIEDASGDLLDATLALVQSAWCLQAGPPDFGLPRGIDPLEGWIATVPGPAGVPPGA